MEIVLLLQFLSLSFSLSFSLFLSLSPRLLARQDKHGNRSFATDSLCLSVYLSLSPTHPPVSVSPVSVCLSLSLSLSLSLGDVDNLACPFVTNPLNAKQKFSFQKNIAFSRRSSNLFPLRSDTDCVSVTAPCL